MASFLTLDNIIYEYAFILDDLYVLDIEYFGIVCYLEAYKAPIGSDDVTWHTRLGHIVLDRMKRLAREGLMDPLARVELHLQPLSCKEV